MPGAFRCQCPDETYGNPFMKGGCIKNKKSSQGLSIGLVASGGSILVLLAFGAPFVTRKIKQQKAKKRKDKFFKQNHGLLFQQLVSQRADMGERMIITLAELEKATNNFDKTREVGGGGHGIVYKGILDLQVVAIKKSKIIVQREIDDFINEVAILSQINHRNVVKLIGCCLEAEVPLLVYEFISNGTLEHHLHVEGSVSLSWNDRLRIALEISTALAYLHSAASIPVYHRDIKSANILLDESLTAKVSDFGASKFIPIDQTGVTTAVQGTIGYLDPMYYYTGRLTDKSDVFSFGVLLVELLTRKRPLAYDSVDGDSLVLHFASLVTGSVLADLLDPQVMEEEDGEVQEVAALAAKCVRLNGEDRPAMREVEMTLENLRIKRKQAARDAKSRRYDDDGQFSIDDTATEGDTEEPSGEYTVEERILLSERYPR
ncbi:wall-associated receptor kinase 3 isoform X3 [Aegilops tauschii subsp. strangulata]|uniref:Protein kinase domain-containing protein n=2 Tax=Aegilops tauschii subsp. strangulata TaxID=200361 RepID=A0A453RIX4_AEGTS